MDCWQAKSYCFYLKFFIMFKTGTMLPSLPDHAESFRDIAENSFFWIVQHAMPELDIVRVSSTIVIMVEYLIACMWKARRH